MRRQGLRTGETMREWAIRYHAAGRCPYPIIRAPGGLGAVGADYKAACPCGKRVRVSAGGLYAHHNPMRPIGVVELTAALGPKE